MSSFGCIHHPLLGRPCHGLVSHHRPGGISGRIAPRDGCRIIGVSASGARQAAIASSARRGVPIVRVEDMRSHLWESVDLWSTSLHGVIQCAGAEDGMEPKFRLCYMPMRNRCEISRLLLEETQTPYEMEVVGFKAWPEVKPDTPLGKVPVLRDYDGKGTDLSQETAIMRFLARQLNLSGRDSMEEAALDELFQQFWATLRNHGLSHDGEHYSAEALKGFDGSRKTAIRYQDMRRVNDLPVGERSLAALGVFEDRLDSAGTGFLVGDRITYVDLALFNILFELAEDDMVPNFAERFELPLLGKFLSDMEARPQLKAYLNSPGRMPRYDRPGYIYKAGRYSPKPE